MTQKDTNPYKYSDSNKRYQTFDYFTRHNFGGKCAKIPLDAGFTCPNKDGRCGTSGCIYCLSGSAASKGGSIKEQYNYALEVIHRKWKPAGYIPYLQANTNTYAPAARLREIYSSAASLPGTVMLSIATRADCLNDEALQEISRISESVPVTVELGLQTSSDRTADIIGRGHSFKEFKNGYRKLRNLNGNIFIGIHIINGLPGEKTEEMLKTAYDAAILCPDQIKIHLLTVLRGTELHAMYMDGKYIPMNKEDYVNITCSQLELMPEKTVVARITGDGPSDVLIAPIWSRRKTEISNAIDRELYRRGTWQGCRYSEVHKFT